jgi:hypothetical protein
MAIRLQINFTDPEAIPYKIEISDPTYTGAIRQVQGSASLEYPKINTMDMLRGSVLKMQLEASKDSNYYAFLYETVGDAILPVTLYRSGSVFWRGFIKPDGIVESYVQDYWYINVQAIDGLGYLENTQFLDSDNNVYTGSVKELDLLARCLQLTGQTMDFRLYDFNIYFTVSEFVPPTIPNNAISDTFVNTERFKQKDKEQSVFTTKEVLESILKKYGAFVTQQDGKWNIIRLIDYYSNETTMNYVEYDSDGVLTGNIASPNRVNVLGSQINGFYPHHANANQQKHYNVALGAYKVLYEYGIVESILKNSNLYFNDALGDIDFWGITNGYESQFTYNLVNGNYIAKWTIQRDENFLALKNTVFLRVSDADILTIKANIDFSVGVLSETEHRAVVSLIGDSGSVYDLDDSNPAVWHIRPGTETIKAVRFFQITTTGARQGNQNFSVDSLGCPENGVISVHFYLPSYSGLTISSGTWTRVNSFFVSGKELNVDGESFSAKRGRETVINRKSKATAVVEIDENIYVGDNESDIYVGAIEDESTDNTIYWSKKIINGSIDVSKRYPLLEWLVRDRLQISSGNSLRFSGGVYGYLPYLGVTTIDKIGNTLDPITLHRFMTTQWSYKLDLNIISIEVERIFQDDIYYDITASGRTLEGVKVIKPLIVG